LVVEFPGNMQGRLSEEKLRKEAVELDGGREIGSR
jgi:hypothetical protein